MKLTELTASLTGVTPYETQAPADLNIEHLTYDSREVEAGTLFFCKGQHFQAKYLSEAKQAGALAYVSEEIYPEVNLPRIQVQDIRLAMAAMAACFYGQPDQKLHLIGLTGTKGKTTVTHYLRAILDAALGKPTAYLASNTYFDGLERGESALTTPEAIPLYQHLSKAYQAGEDYLTMEVSSQALKYERVWGLGFEVAGFTNIEEDHIGPGEHPDFADYLKSKLKIFDQAQVAVLNQDMAHWEEVLGAAKASASVEKIVTISLEDPKATYYADKLYVDEAGQHFTVHTPTGEASLTLAMPGYFNVQNALMALAISGYYGLSLAVAKKALAKVTVPGRMVELASQDGKVEVIVDIAHNRLSYETLFQALQDMYPHRRLTIVFGAPGEKGFNRRYDLPEVASRYADRLILTEEDMGTADPKEVLGLMQAIVKKQGKQATIIEDREEAVKAAVKEAVESPEPSVVILAGKGDEATIKRGEVYEPFPGDKVFAEEILTEYDEKMAKKSKASDPS